MPKLDRARFEAALARLELARWDEGNADGLNLDMASVRASKCVKEARAALLKLVFPEG